MYDGVSTSFVRLINKFPFNFVFVSVVFSRRFRFAYLSYEGCFWITDDGQINNNDNDNFYH